MGQRSVVYETSSGVYQRSFAFSAVTGIAMLVFGIVMFIGQMTIAGAILTGIGAMLLMHGLGMARASRKFKALAAEGRRESTQT